MKIHLYSFLDYHDYLNWWLQQRKDQGIKSSYRILAEEAGIKSKSYLQRVFTGEAPLTHKSLATLSPLFQFSREEEKYFKLLITLKQTKSFDIKEKTLAELKKIANPDISEIEEKKYRYFCQWYHPVIREIISKIDFNDNYQKLGRCLKPPINSRDAHQSVKLLMDLGLVMKIDEQYVQTDKVLIANGVSDLVALRKFQKQMIDMGRDALDRFPPSERNVLTITAGVSDQGFEELNQAVMDFQNQVANILKNQKKVSRACQINLQLFPLTKDPSKPG